MTTDLIRSADLTRSVNFCDTGVSELHILEWLILHFFLSVAPVVKVNNQLIGSPLGKEVEVQCDIEAFPLANNYWKKDPNVMLLSGYVKCSYKLIFFIFRDYLDTFKDFYELLKIFCNRCIILATYIVPIYYSIK